MGIRNQIKHVLFYKLPTYKILYYLESKLADICGEFLGSYAQSKEDLFIKDYFNNQKGFYIDVGVNHPIKLSNTYLLYKSGWQGLTIEPIPFFYRLNQQFRPRDIHLNVGIGQTYQTLEFFELLPSALSTFNKERAENLINKGVIMIDKYYVEILTLKEVYQKIIPRTKVDFLSIDTESFDFECLQSNDWTILKPQLISCEEGEKSEVIDFMREVGYRVIRRIGFNTFFERQR